ncbi:DUF4834 family protein [Paraflavitalea pollutisoli]|uniref:DUF4834 family protein n=1 Tax=Paraflavitalea pollutisoli TaxID=3034143 RepID=UPI0023EBB6D3|nr:DUF4834 family protein [Paraflavitalea sp. H1-2-19X]
MLPVILWILLGYFLYRFVVNFLWPVIKVSRQMRRQVKDFRQHMNQAQQQQQQYQPSSSAQTQQHAASPKEKAGDYIDFEELK